MNSNNFFSTLKTIILSLLILLIPLFFLPITQEFFITNKFYLLAFGVLTLLFVSTIELLFTKKFVWQKKSFDALLLVFVITVALSTLISSPNKIQALLNTNFGLMAVAGLTLLYFYISRVHGKKVNFLTLFSVGGFIVSLFAIVFFFQPFKNISLPASLQYLKNPTFTPIGNQLDLVFILGFLIIISITRLIIDMNEKKVKSSQKTIWDTGLLVVSLLAFLLTLYSLLKPGNAQTASPLSLLTPFRISWFAAIEILKKPLTALFGVGIDNFSSIFTMVKDVTYNQSSLWQVNSFTVSRSTFLHIITEAGLLGLIPLILIYSMAIKKIISDKKLTVEAVIFGYITIIMVLFPPTFIILFLFFFSLALLNYSKTDEEAQTFHLAHFPPLYLGIAVVSLLLIGGLAYLSGRSYVAEYYFKKSIDGLVANNVKDLYDNQRQAIIMNPFIERMRINFAQTNLMIANNIASKAQSQSKQTNPPSESEEKQQAPQLTEQDRQTITQAIQSAIAEAKAVVTLNSQKASNWENLAVIYRNILNVAQGADQWTISAYQRAIVIDPQNPIYRLNLGGIFYSMNNWDEALALFNQAVGLKSDWPNAYYNLAWASYQKTDYQRAVNAMQTAVSLLDPKTSKADIERAQKELDEFKKKLPKEDKTQSATPEAETKPSSLSLPTPKPSISPKISLPKEASPEAK